MASVCVYVLGFFSYPENGLRLKTTYFDIYVFILTSVKFDHDLDLDLYLNTIHTCIKSFFVSHIKHAQKELLSQLTANLKKNNHKHI